MILIIDNYDSFTYNLVQRLGEIDAQLDIRVFRNDEIDATQIIELDPSHLIISPGPCTPNEDVAPCWVCVWGTSRSGKPVEPRSSAPKD